MTDDRYRRDAWRGDARGRGSSSIFEDHDRHRWPSSSEERGRNANRSFFERTGEQLRSWFGDEEERPERGSGYDRRPDFQGQSGRYLASGGDADNFRRSHGGRHSSPLRESSNRKRGPSRYGPEHGYGGFQGDYRGGNAQGGFGGEGDYRSGRQSFSADRYGDQDRGDWAGSSLDDHYRSWRARQLAELDRDYEEYRRERQQQFHSDFDSWRRNRQQRREAEQSQDRDISGTSMSANAGGGPTEGSAAEGTGRGRSGRRSRG